MNTRDTDAAGRSRQRAEWMSLAQRGDRDAYRALLEDVTPLLYAVLRSRVGDGPELADLVQETLLRVHRARHTYDPARPFEPWLLAIARNAATDHGRHTGSREAHELLGAAPAEGSTAQEGSGGDAGPSPATLAAALSQLPVAQREAFELLQLRGMSVRDAAARTGTSPGALKVRAHRAYKVLRALLRR
jgi:RNA polymerase sigma-70 factor (ECF subfamily)